MASPGVEEGGNQAGGGQGEAGGGRGLSGARHASPLFVLLAEEEDDKGEEVGWAESLEELGRLGWTGKRQVSLLLCFIFFFCFVLFNLFCHCFEFKIIQTMPKTPLNIFILLDGLFQKLIKYFRGI